MTSPGAVMIFAAGFGTRMRPLTADKPKPLIEVAGRPLLDHALALSQGFHTVVNTHYLGEQIADHLVGTDVGISHERGRILDTGGGLRRALPLLGEGPVMTLNSDAVWTGRNPLETLRTAWCPEKMDALLALVPREKANGYSGPGDFLIDAGGRLSRGPGHVYSGAQIIKPDGLEAIGEECFSLNRLWDGMLTSGRIFGVIHQGGWCDVGHPAGIQMAERMLREATDV